MSGSRWIRSAIPVIIGLSTIAVGAATASGAADPAWDPPPCPGPVAATGSPATGSWYRLEPVLEDGTLAGHRLHLGRPGMATRTMRLPAESSAAGPFAGATLVVADDGRRSVVRVVDIEAGCASTVSDTTDVVRRATVTPDGRAIIETRLDRTTRRDLGVWQRSWPDAGPPVRILPPIPTDERFGPTWSTDLVWSDDGGRLAVASCGAASCRTRILDPASGRSELVSDPRLGELVALAGDRLVTRGVCRGLPCPVLSTSIRDGSTRVLSDGAGQAAPITDGAGRLRVIVETDPDGHHLVALDPDGGASTVMPDPPDGLRLVPPATRAGGHADVGDGLLMFTTDGRMSGPDPSPVRLRRAGDAATMTLEEVSR